MLTVISTSRYKVDKKDLKLFYESISAKYRLMDKQINLVFVGKNKMKNVALKYKNENVALPVLSFKYDIQKPDLFGEIVICYPQAVLLAAERNKRVELMFEELLEHAIKNLVNS